MSKVPSHGPLYQRPVGVSSPALHCPLVDRAMMLRITDGSLYGTHIPRNRSTHPLPRSCPGERAARLQPLAAVATSGGVARCPPARKIAPFTPTTAAGRSAVRVLV